jgi:hypothetical protein
MAGCQYHSILDVHPPWKPTRSSTLLAWMNTSGILGLYYFASSSYLFFRSGNRTLLVCSLSTPPLFSSLLPVSLTHWFMNCWYKNARLVSITMYRNGTAPIPTSCWYSIQLYSLTVLLTLSVPSWCILLTGQDTYAESAGSWARDGHRTRFSRLRSGHSSSLDRTKQLARESRNLPRYISPIGVPKIGRTWSPFFCHYVLSYTFPVVYSYVYGEIFVERSMTFRLVVLEDLEKAAISHCHFLLWLNSQLDDCYAYRLLIRLRLSLKRSSSSLFVRWCEYQDLMSRRSYCIGAAFPISRSLRINVFAHVNWNRVKE